MQKLTLVPTPIGNLEDITFRAIRVMKEADLILAEDTRVTRRLLNHYDIQVQLVAHHAHNEHKSTAKWVERVQAGENIVLVTDAGTPGISDPGFLLVRACVEAGIQIDCLPGATAFVPAVVNSGLPCDRFTFEGFLPHKKGRQTKLAALADEDRTMVFYESPYRVIKTLEQMIPHFGETRRASASREITKMYEETVRGTLTELVSHFKVKEPRGEFVLVIAGKGFKEKKDESRRDL
jgi:16S rRNA (cytidine1402-2'-O)-methyltransferase